MELSLLDIRFVVVLGIFSLLRKYCPEKYYPQYGAICSALLIGIASPRTLANISLVTLLYIYPVHLLWRRLAKREQFKNAASVLLGVSILGLVLTLVAFKVHRQFTVPFFIDLWGTSKLVEVVGLSYFIFRAISFLHLQSIVEIDERTPWGLLFFMLFPPTLTSGPIQKYHDFRKQLLAPLPVTTTTIGQAVYRITRGYFRKVVLAYLLYEYVKILLAVAVPNAYTSMLTICLLYLYFYFDFAGYSDVAIGLGVAMGITVPENFKRPFVATSVTEFWRNWHISLADWFRDNVFIPLGGMQHGRLRASALAFLIMLLCGLWHGLSMSFLAWGVWHGTLLFLEGVTGSKPMSPALRHGPRYWGRVLWTNARVALGTLFFLPDTKSLSVVLAGFTKWY